MRKNKKGCCFILFFFPFTLLFTILLFFITFYFISKPKYLDWENKFEENKIAKDYHYIKKNTEQNTKTKQHINKKIKKFNNSTKLTNYIEFNLNETAYLIGTNLDDSLKNNIEVNKIYLDTQDLQWTIFVQLKANNLTLPWISFDLNKPDYSGLDLDIQNLKLGPWYFKEYGFLFIEENLQKGFDYAIEIIKNNRFTERELENIELTDDKLIIKSNKYPSS